MMARSAILLVLLIAAAVMLAGCLPPSDDAGQQDQAQPAQQAPSAGTPTQQPAAPSAVQQPASPSPAAQPGSSDDVYVPPTPRQIDPKVKSMLDKAKDKPNLGYSFYFTTTDNWELWRDRYFIKGSNIKIQLYSVNLYDRDNYFDTVYLNMETKTAFGYCEGVTSGRCPNPDREFKLNYDEFIIKTPLDWLADLTYAEWVGAEQFDERLAQMVEYKRIGGNTVRVWLDSFSGIPVQVVVYGDDLEDIRERYGFRDLTVSVASSQVRHQPATN